MDPVLKEGLDILASVRTALQVPITTDVHLPEQCARVSHVVDLLQIPAFLCRTDRFIDGSGCSRKASQHQERAVYGAQKHEIRGRKGIHFRSSGVMLTERGTSFGYGDLVVDMRGIQEMREQGYPVCFDATHSVQRPSSGASDERWG